jgi:hypothetical protein
MTSQLEKHLIFRMPAFDHRDMSGELAQLEMESLRCDWGVKAYVPFAEYRAVCPKVLVVVRGLHHHPIPLPAKTPPAIKAEIMNLLPRFQEELPDLTSRRFLRNPIVKSYLAIKFPDILNPTLSDLHISLANRSHLKAYIDHVRKAIFPYGTDWKGPLPFRSSSFLLSHLLGIFHLHAQQNVERPLRDRYIRCVIDLDANLFEAHPEDEPNLTAVHSNRLRFIVCMGWEGSNRL